MVFSFWLFLVRNATNYKLKPVIISNRVSRVSSTNSVSKLLEIAFIKVIIMIIILEALSDFTGVDTNFY